MFWTRASFNFCCLVSKSTCDSKPLFVCLRLGFVEDLDVVEHVLPCVAGQLGVSSDAFSLEVLKEAFRDRVVMAGVGHGIPLEPLHCRKTSGQRAGAARCSLGRLGRQC